MTMLSAPAPSRADVIQSLRRSALRSIRSYRRFIKWANAQDVRLNASSLPMEDLEQEVAETLDELHRFERSAIDAVRFYARATGQRGDRPCVIDEKGDTIVYLPELIADATTEYESVFATIPTRSILPC